MREVFRRNLATSEKKEQSSSIFRGLVFALFSGISFSIVSVIVKQMKNLHPGQLALYRFIATFVMSMPETAKTGQDPFGPRELRFFLVLRGVFGGIGYFLNFIAFRYLSLSEASVIIFSTPAVVTIFARVIFKEPCNIFQSISVMLTVVGIIFTTKLPTRLNEASIAYSSEKIYGLLAAVFSLFCISAMHLITRKIRSVHQSIITFNYSWVGILEIAILMAVFRNFKWHHCGIQSIYILLLALFSYSGLTFLVMALQCEYAGPVSTVRAAADISLSFVWQIFIFHDVPDSYSIIGAVLVLVSIFFISFGKLLSSNEGNFLSCKRFGY
ncbi:Solute carrier family 35 member G1 [Araneus ventricosus]|uniref:Solute carrier family 35 member G1 n=1 Tax=Araneus ventricosus TaxID=182803 RepID=A0A4Y2SHV2_ARAVE|nr:Solute carrier family 35 member G1 [Araneus ventricosus]